MSLTPSNMLPLGTTAPDFTLPDSRTGKAVSLQELQSDKATVVMFICNHCPYVKHVKDEIAQVAADYQRKGVSFVAISANDVEKYPEDGPAAMKEKALSWHFTFPYLYDETQEVAKAYEAACTPDFYIFDKNLSLVYRGQLDESRPGNGKPLTGQDMRTALDAMLSGKKVSQEQIPSVGCNIKWKD